MVLGDVQAVDAGLVGGGGEFEALVERLRDRAIGGALDVIEDTDFHLFEPAIFLMCETMAAAHCTIPAGSGRYVGTQPGRAVRTRLPAARGGA